MYVSKNCVEFFGYSKEELIGKSIYNFYYHEDIEIITAAHYKHVNECGIVISLKYRLIEKNGSLLDVETISHSINLIKKDEVYIFCLTKKI